MRHTASAIEFGFLALLIGSALVLGALSAPVAQPRLEDILSALQKKYARVSALKSDFLQRYRAPGIEQVESGTVWMKKPGLMRWEYLKPETKLFILDGNQTYLYTPEDRQVMVRLFSRDDLHGTPLEFLLGQGDLLRDFKAAMEPQSGGSSPDTVLVRLVPRRADPAYSCVVIEVDTRTYDLRRMLIYELTGNTSEFVFTNMDLNVKAADKLFVFKPPKGVEVVRIE